MEKEEQQLTMQFDNPEKDKEMVHDTSEQPAGLSDALKSTCNLQNKMEGELDRWKEEIRKKIADQTEAKSAKKVGSITNGQQERIANLEKELRQQKDALAASDRPDTEHHILDRP